MSKQLKHWLAPFGIDLSGIDLTANISVNDVRMDSRDVRPGDVFIAVKGAAQNGVDYIASAMQNGAVAVLAEEPAGDAIVIAQLSQRLPELLAAFYHQCNDTKLIGITGTNGKTTISQLVAQLNPQPTAVIGTLGVGLLNALKPHVNTTPGIADNYRLLHQFVEKGCDYTAMEVSSVGLDQGRVSGLDFDCVVFTNLTQDHLDYHGDLASYTEAKKALFEHNPTATTILNVDDQTSLGWLYEWATSRKVIAVGSYIERYVSGQHVMFRNAKFSNSGLAFTLVSSWGEAEVVSPLFGQFNLNNLVSAMAVLLSYGVALSTLVDAVTHLTAIPGRMEQFAQSAGAVAVVDYAHTPDALAQALQALKRHTQGTLWVIFGCGGDRDQSKRPLMGQIAQRYADRVILTNDNPRHEKPEQIVIDIQTGLDVSDGAKVIIELDRKKAIANTLKQAAKGDVILIAGKGHETYQIFGDEVIDYDERAYVRQCIQEMSA